MTKTTPPTNFVKHTSKNPIQKLLISNFFSTLISVAKPLNAGSILDAGCGEGFTLDKLRKMESAKKYLTQNRVKVKKLSLHFPWTVVLGEKE